MYNPLLLCDFYKTVHAEQYPKDIAMVVSYFTPRMSRIEGQNELVMFGLQGFIKEYLIKAFNEYFFNRPQEEVVKEYTRILNYTLGEGAYNVEKIVKLHNLGYLPIEIKALPEGTLVPVKVPMLEIRNTHPEFPWITNSIETLMSCSLWHPMISANVGYNYRQIVNHYYDLTVDNSVPRARALGDFSMRGQESLESATRSSAGFLLSFLNTATIPAIMYLEDYYNCDCTKEPVGFGGISTEHSVMCSNFSVDGDEITMVKRLLTEIYPNHSFSMVSDSYDYDNLLQVILPACKDEIMAHNGTLMVRGDSGDPVEVVTQTVFKLWERFGGTINSKGFKVLDPHVKAIYGDSITPSRAKEAYQILLDNGYACNNISLGVGSFSMQCLENEDGSMNPYTRDTFGIAVKATYGELKDGTPVMIFKNPKNGGFKKSQKGMCIVNYNPEDEIIYGDGFTRAEVDLHYRGQNLLTTVFSNGQMTKEYSLSEIRDTLHNYKF